MALNSSSRRPHAAPCAMTGTLSHRPVSGLPGAGRFCMPLIWTPILLQVDIHPVAAVLAIIAAGSLALFVCTRRFHRRLVHQAVEIEKRIQQYDSGRQGAYERKPAKRFAAATEHTFSILERQKTRARQIEDSYREILDSQTEMIVQWKPDTTRTFVNKAYCWYLGLPREKLIGSKFVDMIPRKDRGRFFALIDKLTPENPQWRIEMSLILPDGRVVINEWNSRAIFADNTIREIISTGRDVSERKALENQLQFSESKYRALFEQSGEAILLVKDVVIDCNEAAARLVHGRREDLIGKTPADFAPPLQDDGVSSQETQKRIWAEAYAGKPQRFTWRSLTAEQEVQVLEVMVRSVPLGDENYLIATGRDVTEHMRTLQSLEQERNYINSVLEKSPVAVVILDKAGKIVFVNAQTERTLGANRRDLLGMSYKDEQWRLTDHDGNPIREENDEIVRVQRSKLPAYGIPYAVTLSNGKRIFLKGNAAPLLEYANNRAAIIASFEDVSEQILLQRELRDSERRYRTLVEMFPFAVGIFQDQTIMFVNQAACTMFRVNRKDELIGKDMFWGVAEPDIERMRGYARLRREGKAAPEHYEAQFVRADGEHFTGEVFIKEITIAGKRAHQVIVADISERKRDEKQIREQQFFLQQIIESQPSILYLYDFESNNASFLNVNLEELIGFNAGPDNTIAPDQFVHYVQSDDVAKITAAVTHANDEGFSNGDFEIRVKTRDRGWRWFYCKNSVFKRMETGDIIQILGIAQDTTELRKAQRELERHKNRLETLVRQRTARLEGVNRELEAFAYSVSHDLRAPLRHIDGFASVLKTRLGGTLDEKSAHFLDNISEAARRMASLIDAILFFSRTGRAALSPAATEVSAIVRTIVAELQPDMKGRHIDIAVGELPRVYADPILLRQALTNLISNAVKFTGEREKARIEIGAVDAAEEHILYVRDNGAGFDMRQADKLFGLFQRLHPDDRFEGSGIGLATVRRIAHRQGGRTWAQSAPDQGATFFFSLPKQSPEPARSAPVVKKGDARHDQQ